MSGNGNCRELAEHSVKIQNLEIKARSADEEQKDLHKDVTENAKEIALMHQSVEEARQEVHIMRSDFEGFREKVIEDISEIKSAAFTKAQKDQLFQVETSRTLERVLEKLDNNKPKEPEPFKTVKVSQFIAKNPKISLFAFALLVFLFLGSLLIISGQAEYLKDLILITNPAKAK